MYLHNDKELFSELIYDTEREMKIPAPIVEKDYFVTLFLKELNTVQPDIIFKGGTSLSKCYKLIKRFSEDIDLNIESSVKPTEGQRKRLKSSVISIIDNLEFNLINPDNIRSRRDFNRYIIEFPSVREADYLKQHLIVETAVFMKAYPNQKMSAASFIYDYLIANDHTDIVEKFLMSGIFAI